MTLPDREAHLWWIRADRVDDPDGLRRGRDLLTDDERRKIDRFRFARDRRLCLVSRILVRTTLSRYAAVPPDAWRFRCNDYGRPEIDAPASPLRFNLSHTPGMVACLVSRDREVGVDVESRSRTGAWLALANRYFAPLEAQALRAIAPPDRARRFLEYWTLKESYIKARGLGLAIRLADFSFDLPPATPDDVRIRFSGTLRDTPARWQFGLHTPGGRHLAATAVERNRGEPIRIIAFEAVRPW